MISKSDWVAIKLSKMTDFVLSRLFIIKNKNGSILLKTLTTQEGNCYFHYINLHKTDDYHFIQAIHNYLQEQRAD